MTINEQFKMKFNELDQICKKMYPKYPKGFDAVRQFAYSLEGNNKHTLLNLIKARNMNTHDDTDIISFNKEAIVFLQGLIDGANRKYYNGSKIKIDSELENLRTKNLKIMGSKLNTTVSKYHFLQQGEINGIKKELQAYIEKERKASNLEEIKKNYFDFLNSIKMIETKPFVKQARNTIRTNNLEKAKTRAINEIESLFAEVISETSLFNIVIRNKAKLLKKSALSAIYRSTSFSDLEDIVDEYEDMFNDLFY